MRTNSYVHNPPTGLYSTTLNSRIEHAQFSNRIISNRTCSILKSNNLHAILESIISKIRLNSTRKILKNAVS